MQNVPKNEVSNFKFQKKNCFFFKLLFFLKKFNAEFSHFLRLIKFLPPPNYKSHFWSSEIKTFRGILLHFNPNYKFNLGFLGYFKTFLRKKLQQHPEKQTLCFFREGYTFFFIALRCWQKF